MGELSLSPRDCMQVDSLILTTSMPNNLIQELHSTPTQSYTMSLTNWREGGETGYLYAIFPTGNDSLCITEKTGRLENNRIIFAPWRSEY